MNLSSGGLAILAIAAIWFLVFLPSFVKGDQSSSGKTEKLDQTQELKSNLLSDGTKKAFRAKRLRTISITLSLTSLLVATLSVVELIVSANGLALAVASTISVLVFSVVALKAHRKYVELLSGSVRRVIPVRAPGKPSQTQSAVEETQTWQPADLPKQSFLQTGAIEIVELGEVVSIESKETQEEISDIDEILRRRRHVG